MSTEYNNTSDWTLEDCQSYINILYANRTSSFKERKAKAFFNSQTKKNRKTTITNDGIYVNGRLFLSRGAPQPRPTRLSRLSHPGSRRPYQAKKRDKFRLLCPIQIACRACRAL